MRTRIASRWPLVAAVLVLPLVPNAGAAQLVVPRTVPVQQSGQFDLFPSQRASMAGASIALDDTLLDPFVNPAKTTRLRGVNVFTELVGHSVSMGGGGGQTVPVGVLASRGAWSGGALLALQSLDRSATTPFKNFGPRPSNHYTSLLLARQLPRGVSVGASAFHAQLEGLDGMQGLYQGSDSVGLSGRVTDVRAGLTKQWARGKSAELMVIHYRNDISHDVRFPIGAWDPNTRTVSTLNQFEHHDDRSRIIGAHAEFVMENRDSSRFGWLATVNRLTHPKIPNYRFSNLPRDPGTTYAYNLGFGAARLADRSTFGLDVIYEPMLSHTWAEAGPGMTDESGVPIAPDTRTVENRFRFSNIKIAVGWSRDLQARADTTYETQIDFGLVLHRNSYRLRQENNLSGAVRHQQVAWTEWGPTFGLKMKLRPLEISYRMRLTCSPGACSLAQGDDVVVSPGGPAVIAAPGPVLGLDYGYVFTQRLSITLPLHRW